MTCEQCGVELHVGDFPFCPHGRTDLAVHGDDIPGGMWIENGFPEPIKVYSHSEHRALLASRNLEIRAKNAGPDDKICRRWDAPDATTLANAAILLTRGSQAVREKNERWKHATIPISVKELGTFTGKDLA